MKGLMNLAVPLIYTYILYYIRLRQIDIDKGQPNEKQLYLKTSIDIDIYIDTKLGNKKEN